MITDDQQTDHYSSASDVRTLELAPEEAPNRATIPTGSEAYDDSLDALPDSLGFAMRCHTLRWRLFERLQAAPCWIVSVSIHIAAALILATFTLDPGDNPDDLVLDITVRTDERPVINLGMIREVFDPQALDAANPLAAPPVVKSPPLIDDQQDDITEAIELELDFEIIPDDSFLDETEVDLTAEIAPPVGTQVLGLGEQPLGDGGWGFNARGADSYGSVIQNLARRLRNTSKKFGSNVLLVWLVDRSVSMNDDQEAIREQLWDMDRRFREKGVTGKLKQAVVAFADQAQLLLKPVESVETVSATFSKITPAAPNTPENVMAAVIYCAKLFRETRGMQKVIVLVDDDSGDDADLTTQALTTLQKYHTTLYVINRESPFQESEGNENYSYTDREGVTYHGTGVVTRGPETPVLEIPRLTWGAWNWPTNWGHSQVLSGFGVHDQSLLAFHTGGAYYILGQHGSGDPSSSHYDWEQMEFYRPDLIPREAYLKRVSSNPFRKAIVEVERYWNDSALEIKTRRWDLGQLDRNVQVCEARLKLADKLIGMMETRAILPTSRLRTLKTSRRWPANADLVLAQLYLARYRIRQYLYALVDFQQRATDVPKDHLLVWQYNLQPRRTPEETADREGCIRAFQQVTERHPGTPWASIASEFDPGSTRYLHGYRIRHKPDNHPFMALIDFKDGSQIEAKVLRLTDEKLTYQTAKGIRSVPKDTVSKITPTNKREIADRPRI